MDELTLDGKIYLSSKRAAKVTGYAKDYVGQLCREGRVEARLVGRNWYVLESSIMGHRFGSEAEAENLAEAPQTPPEGPSSTWEAPKYIPEPPQILPELVSKPEKGAAGPVAQPAVVPAPLSDMQTAWQEWFQRNPEQELSLPDGSEMLLEEGEADTHASVDLPGPEEEIPVAVHIDRHESMSPVPAAPRPAPMVTQISHVTPRMETTTVRPVPSRGSKLRPERRGNALTRALLLGIVVVAVTVTVIGSGYADQYLGVATNPVADYISGSFTISK